MFLSAETIRDLCKCNPPLIETCRNLDFIEGSSYDVELYSVQTPSTGSDMPFIGKYKRRLPTMLDVQHGPVTGLGAEIYALGRGAYILKSMEQFHLPAGVGAIVFPRTSFFDAQCIFSGTTIAPGFSGYLRNLLVIHANRGIYLEREARYCQVKFFMHDAGLTDEYRGKRHGDVSPSNDEMVEAF
jgi:deoxycytidine triphosphate deaminase